MIQHFYIGPNEGSPKALKTIKEIARQYTGLKYVPEAWVLALNEEIRFVEGRKDGESSLLTATKGMVGAMTAIVPVLDVILR